MTPAQFEVIAKLLRSREPARTAARLVLIDGFAIKDAVAATKMLQPAVSRAVARYRKAHALILTGYPAEGLVKPKKERSKT